MEPAEAVRVPGASGSIKGLEIGFLRQVEDSRGTIKEICRESWLERVVPDVARWRQVNVTASRRGVIRGLHAENMTKLVTVVHGEVFSAFVDVRPSSPTRGKLVTATLKPGRFAIIPRGVCNGFQSTSEGHSQYLYFFDEEWVPEMPGSMVNPLDPQVAIPWPIALAPDELNALVSEKDRRAPMLAEVLGLGGAPID